jgi:hypothetical protein
MCWDTVLYREYFLYAGVPQYMGSTPPVFVYPSIWGIIPRFFLDTIALPTAHMVVVHVFCVSFFVLHHRLNCAHSQSWACKPQQRTSAPAYHSMVRDAQWKQVLVHIHTPEDECTSWLSGMITNILIDKFGVIGGRPDQGSNICMRGSSQARPSSEKNANPSLGRTILKFNTNSTQIQH